MTAPSSIGEPTETAIVAALPASVGRLVPMIGLQATLEVMLLFGGRRLYVPKRDRGRAAESLSALLGRPAALSLIAAFGGRQFDVPGLGTVERLFRAHALARDRAEGLTVLDLLRKYQTSDRSVWRTLASQKARF